MKGFILTNDDIFFGIIDVDGKRYSSLDAPLTVEKLKELWARYPDYFRRWTECGETAYAYAHTVKVSPDGNHVHSSLVSYICLETGEKFTLGANYQQSKCRIDAINAEMKGIHR